MIIIIIYILNLRFKKMLKVYKVNNINDIYI